MGEGGRRRRSLKMTNESRREKGRSLKLTNGRSREKGEEFESDQWEKGGKGGGI